MEQSRAGWRFEIGLAILLLLSSVSAVTKHFLYELPLKELVHKVLIALHVGVDMICMLAATTLAVTAPGVAGMGGIMDGLLEVHAKFFETFTNDTYVQQMVIEGKKKAGLMLGQKCQRHFQASPSGEGSTFHSKSRAFNSS